MKRLIFIIPTILLFTCIVLSASVEDGTEIRQIKVLNAGKSPVDDKFVIAHINSKVGEKLDRMLLSRDVKALFDTGMFSSVNVFAEQSGDGAVLIYKVARKYKLESAPVIEGAKEYSEQRIIDELNLKKGDYVDDSILGIRSRKVIKLYNDDYYADTKVTWKIEETDAAQGIVKVRVMIDEGSRSRVVAMKFNGAKVLTQTELEDAMSMPAWWNPKWWIWKMPYEPGEIEAGRLAVRDLYRGRGYMEAEIGEAQLQKAKDGDLTLVFNVSEGIMYRIGRISVSGLTKYPESAVRDINEFKRLKTGEAASDQVIKDAAQAIRDYYGSRGYIETIVHPVLNPDRNKGVLDIEFKVAEGHLAWIRNIYIYGNGRTKDKVIRRELQVEPGDIFDEVRIRKSEKKIRNLNYFSSIRSYPQDTNLEGQKDLIIEVEEQSTGQFNMGIGFSSIDKAMIYAEISQANFDLFNPSHITGGGQKIMARVQYSDTRKDYNLSFIEPWFLDMKLSLGVDVYYNNVSYSGYDMVRDGVGVSLGKAFGEFNRVDLGYNIEKASLSDITDTNEYFTADKESFYFTRVEDTIESSLKLTLTHDRRDNPFIPTSGNRTRIYGAMTGGPLGFDTDYYKVGANFVQYIPLWSDHVLSLKLAYESVEPFGDTDEIPLSDKLFIGGGRTLRGFKYRDVGPKVTRTENGVIYHRTIGGNTFGMASAEYSIPIVSPIRFAFFYDTGNVWDDSFNSDLSSLAASAGFGIRFDVPGFPIRLDYGKIIEKDNELTRSEPIVFWVGYDF